MRILVVNDDGIHSEGIMELARLAMTLGEVTVAAPAEQHSGMSQSITLTNHLTARKTDFPIDGITAYSVDGTPADCVMTAIGGFLDQKPDLVLSGINKGYNTGTDILYSGTIGACMEALVHGVPAIAFSIGKDYNTYELVRQYFQELMDYVTAHPAGSGAVWNINFPDCDPALVRGILYDREPAQIEFFGADTYEVHGDREGEFFMSPRVSMPTDGPEGTDMQAVLQRYISLGIVRSMVMK